MVASKRSTNSSYVAKSGAVVDFAIFWGVVGKEYSANKKSKAEANKDLAKKNTPAALRAMRDLEIQREVTTHNKTISAAEENRAELETAATASEDLDAKSEAAAASDHILDLRSEQKTPREQSLPNI